MTEFETNELAAICKEAALKFPNDITEATKWARKKAEKHELWTEWVEDLLDSAIRHKVDDARHTENTRIKKASGVYGGSSCIGLGMSRVRR